MSTVCLTPSLMNAFSFILYSRPFTRASLALIDSSVTFTATTPR
jgi:hypothetical protein